MMEQSFTVDTVRFGLARFGFVELTDGRFLALLPGPRRPDPAIAEMRGSVSKDRGRTWGEEYPLVTEHGTILSGSANASIIRLASGSIALQYSRLLPAQPKTSSGLYCATSENEGKTWSEEHRINFPGTPGHPVHDAMIQTKSGRLILPVRACYAARVVEQEEGHALGTVHGHRVKVAGHAQYPEFDIAFTYYSDDEGRTWEKSDGYVLGWPDEGRRGVYPTDEPSVAQTGDGRLLMFTRSTLGRVVESWSEDDGTSWTRGLPNELCNSYSPARLRTIPTTGDLHCVWNQVTPDEICRGFRRSRLSSAISKDSGKTWKYFKTLDCADPLDKSVRQEPDPKTAFVVADRDCGEMPDNWCIYRYPNVRYAGDAAYIAYDRESFKCPSAPPRQHVLRAMPIPCLYDDARNDLSLPNEIAQGLAAGTGESIED